MQSSYTHCSPLAHSSRFSKSQSCIQPRALRPLSLKPSCHAHTGANPAVVRLAMAPKTVCLLRCVAQANRLPRLVPLPWLFNIPVDMASVSVFMHRYMQCPSNTAQNHRQVCCQPSPDPNNSRPAVTPKRAGLNSSVSLPRGASRCRALCGCSTGYSTGQHQTRGCQCGGPSGCRSWRHMSLPPSRSAGPSQGLVPSAAESPC